MHLLDKYLPAYTFREYHEILVMAAERQCFSAAKNLDIGKSFTTKILLKLRGLPVQDLTMQGFLKNMCFTYLEENAPNEFVIDASQAGISICWNFYFKGVAEGKTLISTETRILCLTKKSKFRFSVYWFLIRPFSGLIRLKMLRLIKKRAEENR